MLSASFAPTPRAIRSSAPPAANGAIRRIGLLGNDCPLAACAKEATPARAKTCALFFLKMCVAALVQLVVGVAHRFRPRLAEHHLKVHRLQALIHIAVDHARRAGDAFPRPELDVDASSAFVLDEGGE